MKSSLRSGFTIIELIFAITIIGILAAVAIPKLSANRTDAQVSAEIGSAKTVLNNLGMEYAAKNAFVLYTQSDANSEVDCFEFEAKLDGSVIIKLISAPTLSCPNDVYGKIKELESGKLIGSNGGEKTYYFGGSRVVR